MPGMQVDKMLRRVQSMTTSKKFTTQETLADIVGTITSPPKDTLVKNITSPPKDLLVKNGSKKSGSGRAGVFSVLKVPKSRSLTRLDSLPDDIPEGCLAVYVGQERKRFVISTKYLSHQLFKALLKKCEEEFGFNHQGGLTIACDPVLFEHLLWLIGTNNPAAKTTQLEELLDFHHSF